MSSLEHYRRAEALAWAALGPTDPDGDVTVDLGEHVAYLSRADTIALADVYARLAEIAMPTRGRTLR